MVIVMTKTDPQYLSTKGSLFLSQLRYVIGKLAETIKRYYHDLSSSTQHLMILRDQRVSGANLDWYLVDWTQTTNTIDYGIKAVTENGEQTTVSLERIGRMPMPIDLLVEYTDGTMESFMCLTNDELRESKS
jgi:hypothetical protein